MLTSIRRIHKTTLIIVAVIISITMVWWGASSGNNAGGKAILTVYGKGYNPKETFRLANLYNLARDLGQSGSFDLFIYAHQMYGNRPFEQQVDRTSFVTNVIVMREQAKKLGIEPSMQEVADKFRSIGAFRDEQGEFSEQKVEEYVRAVSGAWALGRTDIEDLVRDTLIHEKLKGLTGAGMKPTKWEVQQQYENDYEQFTAYEMFLKRADFEKGIELTDEAIQAHYDENKANYQSTEKRSIEYVAFPLPDLPEEDEANPAAAEGEDEKEEKEDEEKPEGDPEGETTEEKEGLNEEQWLFVNNELKKMANIILEATSAGEEIEKVIENFNKDLEVHNGNLEGFFKIDALELTKTPPLSLDEKEKDQLPEALKDEEQLLFRIFGRSAVDAESGSIDAAQTRTNIYLYRISEIIEPKELTLEEAREQVEEELRRAEITKRLEKAAEDLKTKLLAELAKAETVEDALKAAGIEDAQYIKPFSSLEPAAGADHASSAMGAVEDLKAGEISDPETFADGLALFYLAKRELPVRASREADEQRIFDNIRFQSVERAFEAWFDEEFSKCGQERPLITLQDGSTRPSTIEDFRNYQ